MILKEDVLKLHDLSVKKYKEDLYQFTISISTGEIKFDEIIQ